jgi:hypothetical protein
VTTGLTDAARPLVGRTKQLALATAFLDGLDRSRGALLLLSGEPGIGKTRLAEEIVERATDRGARSAWGTAWQGDGSPPLWPWVQILRQLTGSAEALERSQPDTPAGAAAARFAQVEAIALDIVAASSAQPLVIVVDDLHWADTATIRALTFVASAIHEARVLVVATYRTGELSHEDIADLARVGTTLAVPRLGDADASTLLRAAVGADVSGDASATVVGRSGGNPLFVWEFGQLMAESGRLDVAPAAVPGAVAAVIERRLARLPEGAVATLGAAAVAGVVVSVGLVTELSQMPTEDVATWLDLAATTGLVRVGEPATTFTFSHDLVRDVVLDGLGPKRRAELHHRAAVALEGRLGADPSLHTVVADHLARAGAQHADEASAQWELAARHAESVLAYEEAAAFFAHAADLRRDQPARRAQLQVSQGDALLRAGNLPQARLCFLDAAALAKALGEPELLAMALLGVGTGPVAWEVPILDNAQTAVLADALAMLPTDAVRLRSMLLARLSVAEGMLQTPELTLEHAAEAVQLAQLDGDPALIGQALAAMNDALAGPRHATVRRDNADAIVELAVAAGDSELELLGHRFAVVADLELGDIPAVDRDIAAFTRLADALRLPLVSWYVPLFRGMRALLAGDLDAADRHRAAVAAAAEQTGSPNALMLAVTLGLGVDLAMGRPVDPAAIELFADIDPATVASYAAGLAWPGALSGDVERARRLLLSHTANGFAYLGEDSEHLVTLTLFGRTAALLGERAAAALVYDRLLPYRGLWAVDGIAACCWGPVDMELGRLALAIDRHDAALEHLSAARAAAVKAGAPLLAAEVEALEASIAGRSVDGRYTASAEPNVFRCDGQFWTLTYRGTTARLKDAKGLRDLARLLERPGRELHVLDLADVAGTDAGQATAGDLGELLDARARAEFRRRLAELDEEIDDAEASADVDRAERTRTEREFLGAELAAALGLGGRPRRLGDPAERARKAVSGRVRMTIGRIGEDHHTLGRHLTKAVRTGTYCVYEPEEPTVWVT